MLRLHHNIFVLALLVTGALSASGEPKRNVDIYCELINTEIPDRVSYPESPAYNESITSYYSGQERDLRPGCIFHPQDTSEVSRFVKLVTKPAKDCTKPPNFAVRSGGHMIWPGSANIDTGITIDMRAMNEVTLNDDKSVATLGVGGVWSDIYPQLVPHNLTVMGGRVSGIGVGGLATGGGLHFLARRNGWVCDNIYRYEVVLADGEIVEATASSHEDLWLALKGGSNNFGIVTKIDVPTWPMTEMLGGSIAFEYTPEILDKHAQAFSDFMLEENFDDAAHGGMTLIFDQGTYAVGDALYYVEPVEKPEVYERFFSIEPQVGNSLQVTNTSFHVSQANGLLPPNTTRAIDIVYSFRNGGPEVYSELFKAWEDGTKKLDEVAGIQLVLLIQPHPVTNGTNSLGLEAGRKDEVVSVITAAYTSKEDDEHMQKVMEEVIANHENLLKERGLYIPYQYLNYADISQDPIGGYGEEIKARLQAASKKYDPEGIPETSSGRVQGLPLVVVVMQSKCQDRVLKSAAKVKTISANSEWETHGPDIGSLMFRLPQLFGLPDLPKGAVGVEWWASALDTEQYRTAFYRQNPLGN